MTCEILRDLKHLYQKANADSVSCNYFDIRRKGEWNPSLETLQRILDSVGIDFFSFFNAVENDMDIEKMRRDLKGIQIQQEACIQGVSLHHGGEGNLKACSGKADGEGSIRCMQVLQGQ